MNFESTHAFARVHDILRVDPRVVLDVPGVLGTVLPEAARQRLMDVPFVTVTRGGVREGRISVGIRGVERWERWPASILCDERAVLETISPTQLRWDGACGEDVGGAGVFTALHLLQARLADEDLAWGPIGSVGFELASGVKSVHGGSDLDLVFYFAERIPCEEAIRICKLFEGLPATVDARAETPRCGFSLAEYSRSAGRKILLRTALGPRLGCDPWAAGAE